MHYLIFAPYQPHPIHQPRPTPPCLNSSQYSPCNELCLLVGYPFLIKPVADDSLCLKRMPDNSVISLQLSCTELFVYRDNFCLHHLETDSTVSFGPNSINTKDSECTTDDKVKINSNGTMTLLNDESKCVVGCTTINCWLTLSSVHPNKPCVVFSFFTGKQNSKQHFLRFSARH